ncbi:MAG: hypothetical protein HYR64_05325 [Fimbriimonas ginsengisoli]|uniref:Uncharacterized protein n=1 Tax=Fimbriimonas ginsengisoli TaxID=1005039 RepID=A0A931PVQ7_FIMGI|nr:hypothetical protein [Fimbriimonas ginsengisoli]
MTDCNPYAAVERSFGVLHDAEVHGVEANEDCGVLIVTSHRVVGRQRVRIDCLEEPIVVCSGLLAPSIVSHVLVCTRSDDGQYLGAKYDDSAGVVAGQLEFASEEPVLFKMVMQDLECSWAICFVVLYGGSICIAGKGELDLDAIKGPPWT